MLLRTLCADEYSIFKSIYQHYQNSMASDVDDYSNGKTKLHLPKLSDKTIRSILKKVTTIFEKEPIVLNLSSPLVILGDLHGHILDLFRIFQNFPKVPQTTYLFLGDLVDRGEFSTETVILVFIMKILFPTNIYILRGNHEFYGIFKKCGFFSEIGNETLSENFAYSFSFMPLLAIIDLKTVCVHGGVGPDFNDIKSFASLDRPIHNFSDRSVSDALWSDPNETISLFSTSKRGTGHFFGQKALETFLELNNFDLLIRGHQCINDGVHFNFDSKCITVFSASNYCGISGNRSGCLKMYPNGKYEAIRFEPLEKLRRTDAIFDESLFSNEYVTESSDRKRRRLNPMLLCENGSFSSMITRSNSASNSMQTRFNIRLNTNKTFGSINSANNNFGNGNKSELNNNQSINSTNFLDKILNDDCNSNNFSNNNNNNNNININNNNNVNSNININMSNSDNLNDRSNAQKNDVIGQQQINNNSDINNNFGIKNSGSNIDEIGDRGGQGVNIMHRNSFPTNLPVPRKQASVIRPPVNILLRKKRTYSASPEHNI